MTIRENPCNEARESRFSPRRLHRTLSSLRVTERSSINATDRTDAERLPTASTANVESDEMVLLVSPACLVKGEAEASSMATRETPSSGGGGRFSPRRIHRTLSSLRISERHAPAKSERTDETLTSVSTSSSDETLVVSPVCLSPSQYKEKSMFSISSKNNMKDDAKQSSSPKKADQKASRPSLGGFFDEDRKSARSIKKKSKSVAPKTPIVASKLRVERRLSCGHGVSSPSTPASPSSNLQDIFSAYDKLLIDFEGGRDPTHPDGTGW